MRRIKSAMAVVLSLVMVATIIPAVAKRTETQAAQEFEIVSPVENELVAAGHFDIEWSEATTSTVQEYQLYIDGELAGTTTETTYEYHTTEVKMFSAYVKAEYADGTSENTDTISFAVTKKGLAVDNEMGRYLDPVEMNMGWYYTWGPTPFSYTTYSKIDFVPMIWGTGNEDSLSELAQKNYKHLLAYNEPDMGGNVGGSNIDVNTALAHWSNFWGKSDYLGAPAPALSPSWSSGTWFRTFMEGIDPDTVDFIPLHCYYDNFGGAAGANYFLEDVVDATWEMYHKPIWITEFAVSGWGYSNAAARKSVYEFMLTVIDGLNERDYVERYSWFSFNTTDESNGASALWTNSTGELTDLGLAYAYYGNPEGYEPTPAEVPAYTVTEGKRMTALADYVTLNGVTCSNYVKADGVTVEASSSINGNVAGNAIDGDISTRWESQQGVDPQTLTINLGNVQNVKQFNIVWEDAGAKDYYIEVSTDGVNYTKVADITGATKMDKRNDTIVLGQMVSAQYIRITGTARTTGYGYSIWDMAVYGTDNQKVDETTTAEPTTRPVITWPVDAEPSEPADNDATTENVLKPDTTGESDNSDENTNQEEMPAVTAPTSTATGESDNSDKNTNQEETPAVTASTTTIATDVKTTTDSTAVARTKVRKAVKKKSAKKVKINLKKISGAVKYQIKISKKKSFKKKNILVTKKVKKVKLTIKSKKLKNRKKLYVRARAIKVINGKTYYGKWSKKKKVKIK